MPRGEAPSPPDYQRFKVAVALDPCREWRGVPETTENSERMTDAFQSKQSIADRFAVDGEKSGRLQEIPAPPRLGSSTLLKKRAECMVGLIARITQLGGRFMYRLPWSASRR